MPKVTLGMMHESSESFKRWQQPPLLISCVNSMVVPPAPIGAKKEWTGTSTTTTTFSI